jgi:excisionase family DNA binding protein
MPDDVALFVRLPAEQARRLDEAAGALPARKKDLVAGLVDRYVRPDSPEGLEALREIAGSAPAVGHHSFRPAAPAEVLDAAQAAELLSVSRQAVVELAERREIPGRKIAGEWRFARAALLAWLSAGEPADA